MRGPLEKVRCAVAGYVPARARRGRPQGGAGVPVEFMETFWQDIQYGLRLLRKNPGFTAVAVITLALGIGANAAIFSLVDGILLRALPYSRSEQLISVTGTYPRGAFVAMREQMRTIDVAAYAEGHEFNLTGLGEPVRLTGTMVSAEMFSILGVRPELGRAFSSGEDLAGQDSYVVLSHALWQQRFGGDPAIVGRSIELEGAGRQVLGVMPPDFHFPSPKTQVWIPLHNDPRNLEAYWAGDFMPVIGRLRPGSTLPQAQAEVRLFQSQVPALFPWTMPASWNASVSVIALQNGMVADVRLRLLLLLGAVALVLLIACANVANLTLSRAAAREKEMGDPFGSGRETAAHRPAASHRKRSARLSRRLARAGGCRSRPGFSQGHTARRNAALGGRAPQLAGAGLHRCHHHPHRPPLWTRPGSPVDGRCPDRNHEIGRPRGRERGLAAATGFAGGS